MKPFAPAGLALLALFLLAAPVHAASFDCAQAGTEIEHVICGDAELSALDELLGDRYVRALAKAEDPAAVKIEQRAWLRDTRNACADAACLKPAYEARIAELTKIGWIGNEKARAICEEVVAAVNDGSLQERFVKFRPASNEDRAAWLKSDPRNSYRGFLGGVLHVDYDGDGEMDTLGQAGSGGTCSMKRIFDLADGQPLDDESINDPWSWGVNDRFLIVRGQGVVAKVKHRLGIATVLGVFTPTHGVAQRMLCRIVPLPERKVEIVEQENPALCQAIAEQRIEAMPWTRPSEELREHIRTNRDMLGVHDVDGTITLDLDLDGNEDTVALLEWSSGAGCAADGLQLAHVDPETGSAPNTRLNKFLINSAGGLPAASKEWGQRYSPGIFQFEGRPYLFGGSANPVVSSIWDGQPRNWCRFKLLPQHEAYPPNE